MSNTQNQILTAKKVNNILKRMAFEIIENNYLESRIFLVGIQGQGMIMSELLKKELLHIKPGLDIQVQTLEIDKNDPVHSEVKISEPLENLADQSVIIVDDVLNTGRTLAYGLSFLMKSDPKSIQTAILVNRSHTSFPIMVTYSGIALSTTLDDHILVDLENNIGAYLS